MIVPHLNRFNNFDKFLFIFYIWIVSNFYYKKNPNTIDVTEKDKATQQTNKRTINLQVLVTRRGKWNTFKTLGKC